MAETCYNYSNLTKLEETIPFVKSKIKNEKFVFDESTRHLQFIYLGNSEDLGKELIKPLQQIVFETTQDNLLYLDASKCVLASIIIKNCPNLQTLNLNSNQLKSIRFEGSFENLELIDLGNNQLTHLDLSPDNFPALKYLYLHNNKLVDLSGLAGFFKDEDFDFNIEENKTLEAPPFEIAKQGKEAIIKWFVANRKKLNEIKIMLVGESESGKTSILKRLKYNQFKEGEEQTDGIIIEPFDFKNLPTFAKQKHLHDKKAYFWDFGGQEIMSSTHQFFMTKRSVYLLVLDARNDEKTDNQVKDWLKRIHTFGGNSPVIVVTNKIEVNRSFGLDTRTLKVDFPQIADFIKISCKEGENIDELKKIIEEVVPQSEFFQTEIDEKWFPVKEKLQEITKEKQYIKQNEFEEICIKKHIKNENTQGELISFLNDLGIVLHFSDLRKTDYFILDPHWVTTGVYRIITSPYAAQCKGEIEITDLDFIVNKEDRKKDAYVPKEQRKIKYYPDELLYLSEIMAEFKLCYFTGNREKILIPDLLDKETPSELVEKFENKGDRLQLIYDYSYLPNSIIHFLMVEMKRDIVKAWRTGVILQCTSSIRAEALVVSKDNTIEITILGNNRQKRDYLSIIRFFLDKVNSKFNVNVSLMIPLPGYKNMTVDFEALQAMQNEGETFYKEYKIKEKEKPRFEISKLLDGVVSSELIRQNAQTINLLYVFGDHNTVLQDIDRSIIGINTEGKSKEHILEIVCQKLSAEFEQLHHRHNRHDEEFMQLGRQFQAIEAQIELVLQGINIPEIDNDSGDSRKAEEMMQIVLAKLEKYDVASKMELDGKLHSEISTGAKLKLTIPFIPGILQYESDLLSFSSKHPIKSWKDLWRSIKGSDSGKKA